MSNDIYLCIPKPKKDIFKSKIKMLCLLLKLYFH